MWRAVLGSYEPHWDVLVGLCVVDFSYSSFYCWFVFDVVDELFG